jgi:D-alanyl-lipoteichoic acid acyltransferase DltB (MBOAT superfamily)
MLFNSIQFIVFFLIVYVLFLALFRRKLAYQNVMLLAASYFFYGSWNYKFLSLIFISTIVDYYCGLRIHGEDDPRARKQYLFFSMFVNLGLLGFFKYFNFFIENVETTMNALGMSPAVWRLDVILPIGISFYTFQTMSYTIDIYYRKMEPTRNIINFGLYVAFFPQLVAGPIVRAKRLLPQLSRKREYNPDLIEQGMFRIAQGFVKKIVFADFLGKHVDMIFAAPGEFGFLSTLLAVYAYAFQIYFDFSGYTDIAIGLANMMSIEIPDNFNLPYVARSFREFWRRWHISLSTWLRDYLYIPLGGNRRGTSRTYVNIIITMLLGGLWHGASWNFVLWGGFHGALLLVERHLEALNISFPDKIRNHPLWATVKIVFTFHLVCLGWIFFRAQSFGDTLAVLRNLTSFDTSAPVVGGATAIMIAIAALSHILRSRFNLETFFIRLPSPVKGLSYALVTVAIYVFFTTEQRFIYFQF